MRLGRMPPMSRGNPTIRVMDGCRSIKLVVCCACAPIEFSLNICIPSPAPPLPLLPLIVPPSPPSTAEPEQRSLICIKSRENSCERQSLAQREASHSQRECKMHAAWS